MEGLLREVQVKERNERCQIHHYEERQAGNPGDLPSMWDQDVQDREGGLVGLTMRRWTAPLLACPVRKLAHGLW